MLVDALKPSLHTRKERHLGAVCLEHVRGQRHAQLPRALQEFLHVDQDLVGIVLLLSRGDSVPELSRRDLQVVGEEAVLLDVAGREGAVEVVLGEFLGAGSRRTGGGADVYPKILA